MTSTEVFVIGAVRTAIGRFGGTLKDVPLTSLATATVRGALEHAGVSPLQVGHVVMGNVIPTEARDAYLSRVAAIESGIPNTTPAFNVNRLCGSGLQAIISGAQAILLGDAEVAVCGGAESMSRSPYLVPAARWGARMGDSALVDYMVAVLHDPFEAIHMGVTAENVAARYGVTREMQDQLAVESQQRAARAIAAGRFKSQIVTVEAPVGKGSVRFDTDESVRGDVTLDQLSKMQPVFKPGGLVTAGNASGSMTARRLSCWLPARMSGRPISNPWLGWSPTDMPASSRHTWASVPYQQLVSPSNAAVSQWGLSTSSSPTKPSPPRRVPSRENSTWIRRK
jgi:acetyl-CoA C-acetyltransferase